MKQTNSNIKYKQFQYEDRVVIETLIKEGFNYSQIANHFGVPVSRISREIKRNSKRVYNAKTAQARSDARRHQPKKEVKFYKFIDFFNNFRDQVASPEAIRSEFKYKYPDEPIPCIKTMYNYIHANILKKKDGSKVYVKRTKPITKEKTYARVEKRNIAYLKEITDVVGDVGVFEVDTIFACRGSKRAIVTLVHRATNFGYTRVVDNRKAETVADAILDIVINDIGKENIVAILSDNGSEFALWREYEQLMGISWFFCDPYCSNQRGQNERFNRDVRKFVWKGSDMMNLTSAQLRLYSNLINMWHRPTYNNLSAKIMENKIKGVSIKIEIPMIFDIKSINSNNTILHLN